MAVMATSLVCGSVYISTLTSSGVRALVASLPILLGSWLLLKFTIDALDAAARAGLVPREPLLHWSIRSSLAAQAVLALAMAAVAAVFLARAYANHRQGEHAPLRVAVQLASIGVTIVAVGGMLFVLGPR